MSNLIKRDNEKIELYNITNTDKNLSVEDVKSQVNTIQKIMNSVMIEGHHYGEIPGMKAKGNEAKKYVLLKPGAEKIMLAFRIANEMIIEDLSTEDERRYRVRSRAISIITGKFLGEGLGEGSTSEEKYKWRKAVCKEEFDSTPENRRRSVWKAGYQAPAFQIAQVRTNPADIANTVLKMAKKRALVDMVLTVMAASDIFVQDLEDVSLEIPETENNGPTESKSPQRVIKESIEEHLLKCDECGVTINQQVYSYSKKFKGKPLCIEHQKNV